MEIFHEPQVLQHFALAQRAAGKTIGLIPTMGFLHEGHLSLIREARKRADIVIVSIFVNPIQFAPNEDFASYPRDEIRDLELCRQEGADAVFLPTPETMYAPDASITICENTLSRSLCGIRRPTHFQGVCTVVAKLFNLASPTLAVFGQKDFQQAAIIKRMVRDLNFPVEILVAPIVREGDGLAKSSRNVYLNQQERQNALGLSRALALAQAMVDSGEREVPILRNALSRLLKEHHLQPDYIEFVDEDSLQPKQTIDAQTHVVLAAFCGKTRLIDNAALTVH